MGAQAHPNSKPLNERYGGYVNYSSSHAEVAGSPGFPIGRGAAESVGHRTNWSSQPGETE